jgi:hypothetical protein
MTRRSFVLAALLAMALTVFAAPKALALNDDDGEFELKGIIQQLPGTPGFLGTWTVSGRTVHVTGATDIEQNDGPVAVGAFVEVKGDLLTDGSVNARKIEVENEANDDEREIEFKGTIQTLPAGPAFIGDWVVGGRVIHITAATRIKQQNGAVAVGAFVEVEGSVRADGSIDARRIEIKSNVNGDDGRHELEGVIQGLPNTAGFVGTWTVAGRTVRVSSATVIEQHNGLVALGALVEVEGTLRGDGSLDASRIEVKNSPSSDNGGGGKLKGVVELLPASGLIGDWRVSGQIVHVTSSTRISQEHGQIVVGTRVKIKGPRQADGSIVANRVQVRDSN